MSLITQCPACNTLFKVVADQLKISEGWVRCGQCREVFDAQTHMVQVAAPTKTPPQPEPQQDKPVSAMAVKSAPSQEPDASKNSKQPAQPAPAPRKRQDFESSDWIYSVNPPQPKGEYPQGLDNPPSLLPEDIDIADYPLSDTDRSLIEAERSVSFVRHAPRATRRRSSWARAGLLLVAMLLLAAGVLQVARYERDRIAAAQPGLQPWLQELCRYTGCTVGPLKQIESVVVDASSFNKVRSDGKSDLYKITVSLKNTGVLPVAVPHIELTLNDSQDQPVLRRILNPADLGPVQLVLAPAAELTGTTSVQIDSAQLAGARIAGYRVLAFYP
jgi:predicted Zn finger-like uncharacterized protein